MIEIGASALLPVGADAHCLGQAFTARCLDSQAGSRVFEPVLRQPIDHRLFVGAFRPGLLLAGVEEAGLLVLAAALVVQGARQVVDLAGPCILLLDDGVVFLTAFAAEGHGQKYTVAVAGHELLTVGGDMANARALERSVDGVAAADELMKAKCKDGEASLRVYSIVASHQRAFDGFPTHGVRCVDQIGQLVRCSFGSGNALRVCPLQAASFWLRSETESCLDP